MHLHKIVTQHIDCENCSNRDQAYADISYVYSTQKSNTQSDSELGLYSSDITNCYSGKSNLFLMELFFCGSDNETNLGKRATRLWSSRRWSGRNEANHEKATKLERERRSQVQQLWSRHATTKMTMTTTEQIDDRWDVPPHSALSLPPTTTTSLHSLHLHQARGSVVIVSQLQ